LVNDPSRGIAIIQTSCEWRMAKTLPRFNPSRGIAIIQTSCEWRMAKTLPRFNPSRGIAIIQTQAWTTKRSSGSAFQSLTRDSNHSNRNLARFARLQNAGFNPSRGIAIIQTKYGRVTQDDIQRFQSLTRDSNHSNPRAGHALYRPRPVSIPHAG